MGRHKATRLAAEVDGVVCGRCGDGSLVRCHAQILAEMLKERFTK